MPMAAQELLTATGQGDVKTPVFLRHDIGYAPGRLHEPSADERGNLWTSPLDGTLWRYETGSGRLEIIRLVDVKADEDWSGHLWPVASGREVYLCCPDKSHLPVYDQDRREITTYPLPGGCGPVYGGFASARDKRIYFYSTGRSGVGSAVVVWDPAAHTGEVFPCPYALSGDLYMTFMEESRGELWGSTYTGNDLVRFDVRRREWTGHWKSPLAGATPTPANAVFGDTLYVSDHLGGRLLPFDVSSGTWGEPIPVPGYREWFGYISGGWVFRGLIYFVHSTWIGGNDSLDGKPHHFLGSLTVFDPQSRAFSRLDIPARPGEEFMCDYLLEVGGQLFLLAVNSQAPHNAVILRTSPPGSAALKPGDLPLRRPVIFSYNHPWGSDRNPNDGWTDPWFMDFSRVRLSSANMVDRVDPQAYSAWRTPDRRILARTSQRAEPWQDDKAGDLIRAWDAALSAEGIDGFAMDEFIGSEATPELIEVWVTAIREIRRRHPDKVLAFWTDSGLGRISLFGRAHQPLLEAMRDCADFVMPEIYYTEREEPGFLTVPTPFRMFREKVEEWEAQAPGITPKILMGLGTVQNADWGYDNLPEVDYGEFLAKQVEVCATDPVLRQMAGLALYAPGYLRPETLSRLDQAIIQHYGLPTQTEP